MWVLPSYNVPGTAVRSLAVSLVATALAAAGWAAPLPPGEPVRGWTLLSQLEPEAISTLEAAPAFGINHLELSHHLVHDLSSLRDTTRRERVNRLITAAHAHGIAEVVLWDHTFYALAYYPARFRTGPGGTLDLDSAEFWAWFKTDYRQMLDLAPKADGIVLTFIETGARAERQHSAWMTPADKLAAVVEAVAGVVIGERGLNLYLRTFSYSRQEYANVLAAVARIDRQDVRLVMKETPHDFFLTHPNDPHVGEVPRPTIVEFDAAGEYNGQNIIAGTWPEYFLERWRAFARKPHVAGYTARVDRYGSTHLVGRPGEINLHALKRGAEDPDVTAEQVYDEFISRRYGPAAVEPLKRVFKRARGIVESTLYTLGLNLANHSALDYDPYVSSYGRHVSGRWLEPPVANVGHGVNREFHYWRDVVRHLAPSFVKDPSSSLWRDIPRFHEIGWSEAREEMNEEYLRHVVTEKNHGVALAEACVGDIGRLAPVLSPEDHAALTGYFERTWLTARLHRAVASAYFGFRVWCRGEPHRNPVVEDIVRAGLMEIQEVVPLVRRYPVPPPAGQWRWSQDADSAEVYFNWIVRDGWPATPAAASEELRRAGGRRASAPAGGTGTYSFAGRRFPLSKSDG